MIKPERKVEIILWDWLINSSVPNDVVNVYFNSKNELGWKTFNVKGIQKKPDLIVELIGKRFFAVEVKDNSCSKNVLMGSKIVDLYYPLYINKKTEYFIDKDRIKLDGFLLASQSSLKGFLFEDEEVMDNWLEETNESKRKASKEYKIIPRLEGKRTFEFIRFLWEIYGRVRNEFEEKPALGLLLANSEENYKPYMMITHYDSNKKKWGQRWWHL
jgi:hypothetical protein